MIGKQLKDLSSGELTAFILVIVILLVGMAGAGIVMRNHRAEKRAAEDRQRQEGWEEAEREVDRRTEEIRREQPAE